MKFEDNVSLVLRIGLIISAILIITGIILIMRNNGGGGYKLQDIFSVSSDVNSASLNIFGNVAGFGSADGLYYILLGLVVLIATPISRVLLSIFEFASERNGIYTLITFIVFFDLMFAIFIVPLFIR